MHLAITTPGFAPGDPLVRISWLDSCLLRTKPCGLDAYLQASHVFGTAVQLPDLICVHLQLQIVLWLQHMQIPW